MRKIKKQFNYTEVKVLESGLIADEYIVEGKVEENAVLAKHVREHGYKQDLSAEITTVSETYVMTAEDFMKYGEKVVEENVEDEENVDGQIDLNI